MATIIGLSRGTVLNVHESQDQVRGAFVDSPDATFVRFSSVTSAFWSGDSDFGCRRSVGLGLDAR